MAVALDKIAIGFYLLLDFLKMLGRRKKSDEGMLIWGDTSSVRTVVIQLCNLAGYIVFTTAREKHYKYLESTGATATFNYRDPEVVRNIARKVDTSNMYLPIGFDATMENDTPQLPADISSAKGHGKRKLGSTLPWPEEYPNLEDIEVFKSVAPLLDANPQDVSALFSNNFLKGSWGRSMWLTLRR